MSTRRRGWYFVGIALSFGGASLLWSVQPMAARVLLPRYGGSAAVWTTSLAFFQTALLMGYTAAYTLHRSPRRVRPIFLVSLLVSIAVFGLRMSVSQAAPNLEMPVQSILMELMYTAGVPYILLATTASIVPTLVDDSHDDATSFSGGRTPGLLWDS